MLRSAGFQLILRLIEAVYINRRLTLMIMMLTHLYLTAKQQTDNKRAKQQHRLIPFRFFFSASNKDDQLIYPRGIREEIREQV